MDKESNNLKTQLRVLDSDINVFSDRLKFFLERSIKQILRNLENPDRKTLEVARALGSLMSSLKSLGLNSLLNDITKIYGNQLEIIRTDLIESSGKRFTYTDLDVTVTEQLIKFDSSLVENKITDMSSKISSAVMRQVVTGEAPKVNELIEEFTPKTVANIKTELNTASLGFSRAVTMAKAKDLGLKLFLYVGVQDKLTRPFCASKVGKIFTQEEINKWDNKQGIPASIYLGGYNCRHHLRPISEERAKELGYGNKT